MSATPTAPTARTDSQFIWDRYRHNFSRHLLGVARYAQKQMMRTLQEEYGHSDLRLGFSPYITVLGEGDRRLSELADLLGISRQACNQAVKQVEAAGYITRTADTADGRAKQLTLSTRGLQLRSDGINIVAQMDEAFTEIIGSASLIDISKSLGKIYRHLSLGVATQNVQRGPMLMAALLPRLSDYIMQRLMTLTSAAGHSGLKLSFAQVLTQIGPAGGRIQQMAAAHDVSKQAISAIANELEDLGYLQREVDPADARQVVLQFTNRGQLLIVDSVASVDKLEAEFAQVIGNAALKRTNIALYELYRGLHLEHDIFEHNFFQRNDTVDISLLARQLQRQLGQRECQTLAQLLLSPDDNTR
jgi:DNA-binding MarR family transcriptional regulator